MVRWLLLLFALLAGTSVAQAADVRLSVPYQTLELGQTVQVEVQVINGRVGTVPTLASDDALQVQFFSQGTSTRRVNFDYTVIRSFAYSVRATREGTFTLGPAEVEVDGTVVQTRAVKLQVKPPPPPLTDDLLAYAEVSPEQAWEGQIVLYRYGLRSRERPFRVSWVNLPTDGLSRPRPPATESRQYTVADPQGGTVWVDETLDTFVVTAGADLDLGNGVVRADVPVPTSRGHLSLFPRTKVKTASTPAFTLKVQKLPPPPPRFTGLVGEFTFDSALSVTEAKVGQSVDWKVRVQGDGVLEGVDLPKPQNVEGLRVYEGSPAVASGITEQGFRSEGVFSRVLVPTRVGRLEVPPIELVTFSPKKGAYVTHTLDIPPLEVSPGRDGAAGDGDLESFAPAAGEGPEVAPEVVDIYPVYGRGPEHIPFLGAALPYGTGLLVLAGLVLLGLDGRDWWRARPRVVKEVVITGTSRLAHLPTDPQERLTVLDDALRAAVAQRLGIPEGQVDREKAEAALPEPLARRLAEISEILGRARFAGEPADQDLATLVAALVHDLEAA